MATFSIPLAQLAEKMRADLDTVVRRATLDVFRAVVVRAPVDSGRFKQNMNVSYGTPDVSVQPGLNPGRELRELAKVPTLPVGGVTYITNALPYARRLEYGYSKQAPSGVFRLSALEFNDYVQKAIASK